MKNIYLSFDTGSGFLMNKMLILCLEVVFVYEHTFPGGSIATFYGKTCKKITYCFCVAANSAVTFSHQHTLPYLCT